MDSRTTIIVSEFIIFVALLLSAYYYALLPDNIAVHWDVNGNPNGFSPKHWILIFPAMYMGLVLLVWTLPFADPLRRNVEQFRTQYNLFIIVLSVFLALIHILMLAYNLGWIRDVTVYTLLLLPAIFIVAGWLMYVSRPNWFIGFRTPWTISSERVWVRVNRAAGILFVVFGVISVPAVLFGGGNGLLVLIALLLGAIAVLVIWSYALYSQEEKGL